MMAIIEIIIAQTCIWAPSLVALITNVVLAIRAANSLKQAAKEVKSEESYKKLHEDLARSHEDNRALRRDIQILIDKQTGVRNYGHNTTEEEEK